MILVRQLRGPVVAEGLGLIWTPDLILGHHRCCVPPCTLGGHRLRASAFSPALLVSELVLAAGWEPLLAVSG